MGPQGEVLAPKRRQKMPDDEIQSILRQEIQAAADFIDLEIAPQRIESMKRYKGEAYGDEQDGRSKVVSRDVRDTIKSIIPSLMKVFFSSEHVVEFVPRKKETVDMAEQATEYIRYIFNEDNKGFLIAYEVCKDALINKTGVLKWWYEEEESTTGEKYTGLSQDQLLALATDDGVEVGDVESYDDTSSQGQGGFSGEDSPAAGMGGGPPQVAPPVPKLYDVTIKRTQKNQKFRIMSLAPEQFLINRSATSIETADLVAHRSLLTASELLEMGYKREDIDSVPGDELEITIRNLERIERSPSQLTRDAPLNPALRRILHHEVFCKLDVDGDGIAELRRICTIGPQFRIIDNEPWDEIPFAIACPEPEPHEVFGTSISEIVSDIQRIKSQIQRGMLDSLAQAITPRTVVVEGQVNISDVLNNEVGGIIRARAPGMVQPFETTFLGQAALPVLAYYDDVKQTRTGMSQASMGLDADALQSTTQIAVAATVDAAKQHLELIARIFAETLFKPMFKGLLRLVVKHQDKARMIRLRNRFVEIDPRSWDCMMDVYVNVGLGDTDIEGRIQALQAIAVKQEQIMLQGGPGNPICGPIEYATTLRKATELYNFADPDLFFKLPTAQQVQQIAQAASQQHQDPQAAAAQQLAQVQMQQIQADMQNKAAERDLKKQTAITELQLKAQQHSLEERKVVLEDARARDQMMINAEISTKELQLKYGANVMDTVTQIHMQQKQIDADAAQQGAEPV